jgi:superfamily I DNA/RNA helicase
VKAYDVKFATSNVTIYLAAAGAGKTTALMDRFSSAIDEVRPDEVGMFTFTKKGVTNFVDRALATHKHLTHDDLPYVQTLHAMCFKESGLKHKNIIELLDIRKFNDMTGFHLNLAAGFDNQTDDDKLMQR